MAVVERIVYYPGCFANYYDPEIGKALIEVMRINGIEVIVPDWVCCGMPMLANGNLKGAAKNVKFNLESLSKAASPGYKIITTCPSGNLMLRKECLTFFDSDEARFVSENTYDAGEFLFKLHQRGRLSTNLGRIPLKVFYHSPCHLKVQNIIREPLTLLRLIPGVEISRVNTRCCGMGGSYGMKTTNYKRSVEIAKPSWEDIESLHRENKVDNIVTECGGCKLQLEAGTGIKSMHPIMLLDQAYRAYKPS